MNNFNAPIRGWDWSRLALAASLGVLLAYGVMANAAPKSSLVDQVRAATKRYANIHVAFAEGWSAASPCVSGPDTGAMGVHLVLQSRIGDGIIDVSAPQALMYEPRADGSMRLVGVEYIVLASTWAHKHPGGPPPALAGHLFNLVGAPNRYGMPAFFELHVWAWRHNPMGTFADWNPRVTCDHQPTS